MAVRRSIVRVVLGGLLLLLAVGLERPVAAEESAKAKPPDPEKLLEGLAPLAEHGGWTLEKEDDRSPEPPEPPSKLPAAYRKDFGKGLERLTRHTCSIKPENGWTRSVGLSVMQFKTEQDATAYRKALRAASSEPSQKNVQLLMDDVRTVALCDGTVQGFCFECVIDVRMMTTLLHIAHHCAQRGRTVLSVQSVQCAHISPETTRAFIEYAFRRLEDPAAKPPPSPRMALASRDVELSVETPDSEQVGSVDVMWRRVAGGDYGKILRVGPPWKLTLPKTIVQLRIGHARSPTGVPVLVLGADVLVDATREKVVFNLPTAGTARVRVLGADGTPISGATVQTISRPLPRPQIGLAIRVMGEDLPHEEEEIPEEVGDGEGQTNEAGWVTLPVHPVRRTLAVVRKGERYLPIRTWLKAGTPTRTLVLKAAWTFRALVTDRAGRPLACDAQVQIGDDQRQLETDDEGRLQLGPIPRAAISVHVDPKEGWDGRHDDHWRSVEPTEEVVRLTVACDQLDVRVVGPDGKDVPRCWLELMKSDGGASTQFTLRGATRIAVPTFSYTLEAREARDDEDRPLSLRRVRAVVEPGTRQVTLRMEEGRTINGLLLDPDGKPVAGAEIRARVGRTTIATATTDTSGGFKIVGLGDRRVMLAVDPPVPHAPTRVMNVAPTEGAERVEFRLPKAVPITVVDGYGGAVPNAYVALWTGDGARELYFEAHTDETGRVYFPNLGIHQEIRVQMQNGEPLGDARRVWDGKPITIRLPRAFTAKMLVVEAKGPAVNAEVEVENHDIHWRKTDPAGRVTIRYIPDGSKRARARRRAGERWSEWVPLHEAPQVTKILLPNANR